MTTTRKKGRALKGAKTRRLSGKEKAEILKSYLRNLRISRHRRFPNTSVKPISRRISNYLENIKDKKKQEEEDNKVKIVSIVVRLRRINNQLKKALEIYDEEVETNNNSDIVEAVSVFLSTVYDVTQETPEVLEVFQSYEDNPADYVEELTDYIDENIIKGYKKVSKAELSNRIRISTAIIDVLFKAIMANVDSLNMAISGSRDKLSSTMKSMIDDVEML